MFNQISWAVYVQIVCTLLVAYYVFIGFVYYKQEITALFSQKPFFAVNENSSISLFQNAHTNEAAGMNASNANAEGDAAMFTLGNQLMSSIQSVIERSAYAKAPKEELLFGIQQQINDSSYLSLYGTSVQDTINRYIHQECTSKCSFSPNEDELKRLWVK